MKSNEQNEKVNGRGRGKNSDGKSSEKTLGALVSQDEVFAYAKVHALSPRETEIVGLLVKRIVHFKDIAQKLTVSPSTVNNHFKSIFEKTRTNSKSELLACVLQFVIQKYDQARAFAHRPEVLVVDDEAEICEIIAETLSERGLLVETCSDPLRVRQVLQERQFDVIVSDIRMPKLDGVQLLKEIRAQYKYFPFVVFISGYSSTHDVADLLDLGAVDLLPKPLDLNRLYVRIMEHCIRDVRDRNRHLNVETREPLSLPSGLAVTPNNIGYGGVFIPFAGAPVEQLSKIKVGDLLSFPLPLDDGQKPIDVQGEVVWRRNVPQKERPAGIGVKFTNLAEAEHNRVMEYVRQKKIVSFVPIGS